MSRGVDSRIVSPPSNEPVITLDIHLEETNDRTHLLGTLFRLADSVFEQCRKQNKSCSEFKLALRYSDFKYLEKTVNLKTSVKYSHEIYDELKRCFSFLFTRRTAVRYFMIELRQITSEQTQLNFFDDNNKKIFNAIDDINKKFPEKVSLGKILR